MGTSKSMRIVTWLVIAAILFSASSPVLAARELVDRGRVVDLSTAAQTVVPSLAAQPSAEPAQSGEEVRASLAASQPLTTSQQFTATVPLTSSLPIIATDLVTETEPLTPGQPITIIAPVASSPSLTATASTADDALVLTEAVAEDIAWTTGDAIQAQPLPVGALPSREAANGYLPPLSLELLVDVQPNRAIPGEIVTYQVNVVHTGYEPLANVVISDPLPGGLVYVQGSASNFGYSPRDKLLTWNVVDLQPGQVLTGTFQARATGLAIGQVVTNTVSAMSALADGSAQSAVLLEVAPPAANRVRVTPVQGGWLRSQDKLVEVKAPAGVVQIPVDFTYQPLALDPTSQLQFAFELQAEGDTGEAIHQFQAPVTLIHSYQQRGLSTKTAEGMAFFHLDEVTGTWQLIATRVDPERGLLIAKTDHFSTFAVGDTGEVVDSSQYEFDPGARIRGAQPQLFSGSVGFSYGFDLLPGAGGLAPALGLQYSSSRHQREIGHYNHVGHGWDLLGENYAMKSDPVNPDGSTLTVVINGATYTIDTTKWFTKENPFIQMWEYRTPCKNNCPGWYGTQDWRYYQLKVRTTDGVLYTFKGYGYVRSGNPTSTSEPPLVYRWEGEDNCQANQYPSTTTGYPELVRMPLVETVDPSGNVIKYVWDAATSQEQGRHGSADTQTDDQGCNYVRTIRLREIQYNFSGATPQTKIKLRYDKGQAAGTLRYDRTDYFEWQGVHLFAIYKLLGVDVVALNSSGAEQIVRTYNLNYYDQCAGGCDNSKANTLLLPSQIVETAGGLSETTSFSYDQNKTLGAQCQYGYLSQMTNPYGGQTLFTATVQSPASCSAPKPPLVATYTMKDLVTNQPWTWEYSASGWNQDVHGYAQVNVLWPDLGDGNRRLEQHFFKQKVTLTGSTTIDHLAGREWKTIACLPVSASPSAACATELTKTETDWYHSTNNLPVDPTYTSLPAELQPRFVYAGQMRSYHEGQRMVRSDYAYEIGRQGGAYQFGNLTLSQDWLGNGSAWASSPLRTTYNYYYPNTTYWIANRLARSDFYEKCWDDPAVQDYCDGGAIKSQQLLYYDDSSAYASAPGQYGRLTRQEGGLGSAWQDTRYSYWTNGNLRKTERWDGGVVRNSSETFYDSRFQAYPVCSKNIWGWTSKQRYFGVPGSTDAGCTTSSGSNLPATGGFFGQLEEATDENGQSTSVQYDGLGRAAKVILPGDIAANPTLRFTYTAYSSPAAPFWIKKEQREDLSANPSASYLETRVFYDGFGRVLQTQAEAASAAQSIVASTQYNATGQALKQNTPYFYAAALGGLRTLDWTQPTTQSLYDAYGRVKQVTSPDGSKTCSTYQGLQTAVIYEQTAGGVYKYFQKISETDKLGRLSTVKDYLGAVGGNTAACPTPNWAASPNGTTTYTYNVADALERTTAPDGAQIAITYDGLGRKIQMNDPDMGVWTYGYDALSNLTRQTDARNQTICFYYDALNRVRGKHYRNNTSCPTWSSNPTLAAQYTYDDTASGNMGIGRRTGMTDSSGSATWVYDSRGRLTKETKVINGTGGGTFVTQWNSYDAMDRVRNMVYPDNENVAFTYTSQGPVKSVSGTSVYTGDTFYNALGQVTDRYLGSTAGVIRQQFTYTAGENFRLTALRSGVSPNYNNLQNATYSYDDQSNVLNVVDAAAYGGSQTQTFTYDGMNRLLTAQATGGSNGTYGQRSYVYNNGGNITTFEGATLAYNDAAHKHAVTHVGGVQRYLYDPNGNATNRITSEQSITLAYDAENHLTGITGTGSGGANISISYTYDGDGKRVAATVGNTTTVYIGNIYERDNGTTVRKYYYAGSVRVALRSGGQTYYQLNDHLTSTAITTNSSGVRQTELRYYAYGGTRYDPGSQMTIYRYTGQRIETTTGLYDYGARWYDPQIGRFLSADTIVPNPGSSQSLNRYMYVVGNPLKYSDPTGHANECRAHDAGGGGGGGGTNCGSSGNSNSQPSQPAQTQTPAQTPTQTQAPSGSPVGQPANGTPNQNPGNTSETNRPALNWIFPDVYFRGIEIGGGFAYGVSGAVQEVWDFKHKQYALVVATSELWTTPGGYASVMIGVGNYGPNAESILAYGGKADEITLGFGVPAVGPVAVDGAVTFGTSANHAGPGSEITTISGLLGIGTPGASASWAGTEYQVLTTTTYENGLDMAWGIIMHQMRTGTLLSGIGMIETPPFHSLK